MIEVSSTIEILQWLGSIVGVLGAWWVGNQRPKERGVGFICFILSNIFLISVFVMMRSWPLLGMQIVYLGMSIRGLMGVIRASVI